MLLGETQDTGSDEGKELEKEPKTSTPESASSVFGEKVCFTSLWSSQLMFVGVYIHTYIGECEQVCAAESYEKKDEKAPKSLIEAPSSGELSELVHKTRV